MGNLVEKRFVAVLVEEQEFVGATAIAEGFSGPGLFFSHGPIQPSLA